jgi:hypothetical protein
MLPKSRWAIVPTRLCSAMNAVALPRAGGVIWAVLFETRSGAQAPFATIVSRSVVFACRALEASWTRL